MKSTNLNSLQQKLKFFNTRLTDAEPSNLKRIGVANQSTEQVATQNTELRNKENPTNQSLKAKKQEETRYRDKSSAISKTSCTFPKPF